MNSLLGSIPDSLPGLLIGLFAGLFTGGGISNNSEKNAIATFNNS